MNWKDILERAAWTALQGGISAIPVAQIAAALTDVNIDALTQLLLVGVGGAVASLLSFLKTVAQERTAVLDTRALNPGPADLDGSA